MGWGFRRKGELFVARLDVAERTVVAMLIEQTRELLAPTTPAVVETGDAFEDLVAGLDLPADLVASDPPDDPPAPRMPRGTDPASVGPGGAAGADADPALARLLPDAHRGDPEVAAEFRRLAEQDLRRRKADTMTTAIDALRAGLDEQPEPTQVALDRAQADALLVALTDTRLLIAERIGLHEEQDWEAIVRAVDRDPSSPGAYAAGVYDYLTHLQGTLVEALLRTRRS
ncbi:MAG TPA: DUF2017 family protein [Dermatophilaceae bacterium]|nr:DUF2017 family protein [Dermatophilaceae bacterium]